MVLTKPNRKNKNNNNIFYGREGGRMSKINKCVKKQEIEIVELKVSFFGLENDYFLCRGSHYGPSINIHPHKVFHLL